MHINTELVEKSNIKLYLFEEKLTLSKHSKVPFPYWKTTLVEIFS